MKMNRTYTNVVLALAGTLRVVPRSNEMDDALRQLTPEARVSRSRLRTRQDDAEEIVAPHRSADGSLLQRNRQPAQIHWLSGRPGAGQFQHRALLVGQNDARARRRRQARAGQP